MRKYFWIIVYICLIVVLLQNTLSAQENTSISFNLQDQLLIDRDGDGLADPGDIIRYTASVTNCGSSAADNVQMNASLDPNTSLKSGSVQVGAPQSGGCSVPMTNTPVIPTNAPNLPAATPVDSTVPGVTANTPASASTEIALAANLSITFSEAVTVTGDWFQIVCTVSGTFNPSSANVTVTGGPTTFTLDPNIDFQVGESCTVTIAAAQVHAQDNNAPMAANHVFSFATETPPTITATTPVNGAAAVNPASDIVVTFDETVNVTAASFNPECPAGTPFAGGFAVAGTGTNTITINPTGNLPAGTMCQVVAVAANISDVDANDPPDLLDGNADNVEGDDYTFTFTTDVDSAPTVQTIAPANGAVSVATSTTITITFDESVDVASATAFSLECPAGSSTGFAVTTPATLPASATTFVLTPLAGLPASTVCTVTVFAAQVADTDTFDPPDTMAANFVSTFTTEAPPSVTGTTPVNAATGIATNSNIVINFNELVTVTTASFTVECPAGTPVTFAISGSGTNSITLDPTVNLPATTTCTVTVVAAQVSDVDVIDPPDTMTANYTFAFDTLTDAAPTVNQAAILPASTAGGPNTAALNASVSTTPTITIPFSEAVDAAAGAFTLDCPGAVAVTVSPALPATNQTSFNISPTAPLTEGANCTLTVMPASISDTDTDDPPNLMAANYTITFVVDTAPAETLTETEVGGVFQDVNGAGAANVDLDSDIRISFNEPVNVTLPANALQCPAGNNIASTVTGNGTATVVLNPNVNLPINTLCVLNIPAANISDVDTADAPDTPAVAVAHTFQTVDDDAPTVMTNPTNGGSNVAVNSNITVSFNEPVTLTGAWFALNCTVSGNRVSTGELTGTGITIIENTPDLVYTIDPTADFSAGDTCTITIDSANVVDNDLIDPPNELDGDASADLVDGDTDDYVATFSTSDMPPQVNTATSTPANGATVPNNQALTFNFTEMVDIAAGGITWQCGVTNIAFTPALPQNNGTTITLTPGVTLPSGSNCTVTLESTLITDDDAVDPPNQLDGDSSNDVVDGDADDFVLTFTVDEPPTPLTISVDVGGVPSFLPLGAAQRVDAGSDIRVTFSEPVDATTAGMTLQCPVGTPIAFTGLPATNTSTITLNPTADLPAATVCQLTLVHTGISDTDLIDPPNLLDGNGNGVEGDSIAVAFTTQADAVDDAYTVTPQLTYVSPAGVRANDNPTTVTITGFGNTLGTANSTVPNGTNSIPAGGAGGRVVMNPDGTFNFYPDAGDDNTSGTVTFFYTITGGDTAQVTLTFEAEELVWFADTTGGACTFATGQNVGTQACPATDFITAIAASHTPNDIIFIASGNYQCAITLQNNVLVIGNGSTGTLTALAASRVTPVTGSSFAPYDTLNGAAPNLNTTAGDCFTLGQNNTLRGFTVADTPNGHSYRDNGGTIGTATILEVSDTGTGGIFNFANGGTLNATMNAVTSTASPSSPILLTNIAGTITQSGGGTITNTGNFDLIDINGGSIGGTISAALDTTGGSGSVVDVSGGHTGTLTFSGAVSGSSAAGDNIQFDTANGNYTFSSTANLTAGSSGVTIRNSVGGSFTFSDVTIDNRSSEGIYIDNADGGTVSFGNTTVSNGLAATAAAVRGENSTSSVTFAQLDINQGNVGTGEAFAGNIPGATTGTGDAVYLNAMTGGFTLNAGTIQNTADDGIDVRASSNVNITGMTLNGRGTATTNNSSGIQIYNGSGTYQLDNLTINDFQGTFGSSVGAITQIMNTGNTLTLDIDNGTWTGNSTAGNNATAGYGFRSALSSGTTTIDIDNTNFTDIALGGVNLDLQSAGNVVFNVRNADFNGTNTGRRNNVSILAAAGHTGTLQFAIDNNTFTDAVTIMAQGAVHFLLQGATSAAFTNSISGNTMSWAVPAGATGIFASIGGTSNLNANIDLNTITNLTNNAINIQSATVGGAQGNINLRNNTLGTTALPVGQGATTNQALVIDHSGSGSFNLYIEDTAPANSIVSSISSGTAGLGTVVITNGSSSVLNATLRGLTLTNTGGNQNTLYAANGGVGTLCLDIENTAANAGAGEFDIRQLAGPVNLRFVGNNPVAATTTGTIGATAGCTMPIVMVAPIYAQSYGADVNVASVESPSLPAQIMDTILNLGVSVVSAQSPATVTIPFGSIPANSTVSATFDVVVGENIPAGVNFITLQGTLTGNGFGSLLSNDPDTGEFNDATRTLLDPLRTVKALPSTGELPWWRGWMLVLAGLGVLSVLVGVGRHLRLKWIR